MRKPAVLGVSAFLAAVAPALAGQLFIPLASNRSADGQVTYRTRVWVSNPAAADKQAATTFIEQGADGTSAQAGPGQLHVPAGGTLSLSSVAPDSKTGMLEISGDAELMVSARVEAIGPSGVLLSSASVPAVAAENALPAGAVLHLQGLGRAPGGAVTNFALLNLSTQAATCTVSAFRVDGTQIAHTANVGMPALGTRQFDDAFAILGELQIADGRFETSCDQQFYAYATVLQVGGPVTNFVEPSRAMVGTLVADNPPPPAGTVTLNVPGVFLHATNSNSFISYDLAALPGVAYTSATVEFDLTIHNFNKILLFTGVHSFRRPNKNRKDRVLYYALQLVNRNSKTILDLGVQDVLARSQGPWKSGHTYHLKFTYDVGQRLVQLDVSENGAHIYSISGPAQHFDLSANQNPITVDFGQTGIGDGAYGPPLGWTYANLSLALTP
jgi:hypothetical protein